MKYVLTLGCMILFCSLVGAATPSITAPLPVVEPDTYELSFSCEKNPVEIKELKKTVTGARSELSPLRKKRERRIVSEAENTILAGREYAIMDLEKQIWAREYMQFYCDNPDKIPQPPIDPNTIS